MSCIVPGCNNHSSKTKKAGDRVSYFHIPLDHRRKAWIDRIRRTNLPPLENCHVCSEHFLPSCFESDLRAQLTGQPGKRKLTTQYRPYLSTAIAPKKKYPGYHPNAASNGKDMTKLVYH